MTKKRNRLIAVGIALLLIIAAAVFIFPAISASADDAWDGTTVSEQLSGAGTEDEPYLISNGAELAHLAQEINAGKYADTYFQLTADIDLGGNEWTPIGFSGDGFKGNLDGDGKTISNFKSSISRGGSAGLFGYNSGTIQNVYVDNFEVKTNGSGPAAGLCGTNNASGIIEGCATLGGSVGASNYYGGAGGVGGICANNSGKINKCYNMASVKTGLDGGGVVNANQDGGTVSNCYNAGEVSSTGDGGTLIGGICSKNIGTIKYCVNYGNVNNGYIVGGICGQNDDGKGTISSCYSDSTVCKAGAVGTGSKLTDVKTMTTEELCGDEFWNNSGFDDSKVWEGGTYEGGTETSLPSRFGKISIKYPTLQGVSKDNMPKKYKAYNFKTDGADNDWQPVTVINDADGLAAINDNLDGNYVLGNDITLTGEWTPIGSTGGAFSGKFSGDGHTISGVNVNVTNQNYPAGLFGYSTGVIMNLAVVGEVRGTNTVGGICGGNSAADGNGIIYACSFKGIVTGTGNNIGGICGYNFMGNSKISNCFSAAYVYGNDEVGGICGYNETNATVSNTISVGTVSGRGNLVAAVCGKNDGTLKDNYFDSTVSGITVGAKDGEGNKAGGTTGKTTAELCEETSMRSALDTSMWNLGNITFAIDSSNARKRTVTYTYPSLKGIAGSVYFTEVKEYNFSTNDYESWRTYTEIGTAKEFITLGNDESKWSGNYVLTADIDLSGMKVNPIGTFTGNFSGDGHTISGVNISSNGDYVGLFGCFNGGGCTIMNLAVEGNIVGKNKVGGICGGITSSNKIFACTFAGTVSGEDCVGGICGYDDRGTISDCFNSGTVTGTGDVGGVCGYRSSGYVQNCINVSKVSGNNPIVGEENTNGLGQCYNNYYDSTVLGATADNNIGTAKTTAELCDKDALGADKLNLSSEIWQAGGITRTTDAENARMSVANTNYPSLIGVGEPLSLGNVKQYNFKTTGTDDDWQEYTEITSAADLDIIRNNPNGNYVLMNNIKLTGNFTPIGNKGSFSGKFSGNGHTISGVKINGGTRGGLFDWNKGLIMNLAVEGDVTSDSAGGICEYNYGTIYACSFKGSVKGSKWVGGICGLNTSTGTITGTISNCYVIGSIEATDNNAGYAGGICGKNENSYDTINCCYFAGTSASPYYYDAICYGFSKDCYFDRELFNINNYGNDALTTAKLCGSSLPYQFSSEIWEKGSFTETSPDGKFRTVSFTYPRLKEGCAAYEVNNVKQYNFGMDGNDNWAQFNEINSLDDLNNINKNPHTNYVLMKDIDLNLNEVKFSPLVPYSSFWGYFSGDGHTIKGDIVGNKNRKDNAFTALFSSNYGLIMNLAVKGNVSGVDYVGGICGRNNGTIYGCSFEGSVKGNKWVGGICGEMSGSYSHIINCYVIGSIEAATEAGGILGASNASGSANIKNCYFVGTVTVPDSGNKDAICSNQTDIIKNCYYNSDLYTGSATNGTGLSTLEMTSSGVINKMAGSGVWQKNGNKPADSSGKNGVAYYPALVGSNYVPSVKFNASLTFERTDDKALTFLDEFEVKYGGVIEFENGVKVDLDDTNCVLTAVDDSSNSVSLTANPSKITVTKAGKTTYTFKCAPKTTIEELLPSAGLTKSLAINAAKYTLKPDDFNCIVPLIADSAYNGKAKSTTVEIANTNLSKYGGCGDITVRYFDSDGKPVVPINAGDYTVKIDVTEGTNCKAITGLTADSWKLTIKATIGNPPQNYEFYVNSETKTYTLSVVDLDDDLGESSFVYENTFNDKIIKGVEFNGKNITFTLDCANKTKEQGHIGITSQNYGNFGFNVTVNVNDKGTQPKPEKCEVTLKHDDTTHTYTATIKTVDGAEYKFGKNSWSENNKLTGIKHGEKVNASIRMAATANMNASENVTKTLTAGTDLKWKSDKGGHWQACNKCDYEETSHSAHIFIGNSCAVCGYKKSGGSSSGGGGSSSGGGSYSGGGSSGGGSSRPTNPAVDGKEMTWNDVTNEINKLTEGGEATIDLNGNTTVPKDVIKAIKDKKALVTIKVNSTFSWTIDGSKLTDSDIKDIDFMVSIKTASGTETLRGTVGTGFKIDNVTDKAVLNITFKAAHSGKFANLYKKADGKLEFVDNVKIDENGNALGLEVYEKGEYAVMLGEFSDRAGDMDNDGILNAKDALAVLRHSAMIENGKNPAVADMDGDNVICAKDALIILKIAAGIIKI